MAAPSTPPEATRRPSSASGEIPTRTIVQSGLVLLLVLVLGVGIVALTSDDGGQGAQRKPGELPAAEAIPKPGSGKAPESAGDRGGAGQLGLFAIMAAGMVFIGVMIFRGGRTARTNRARWRAAASTGRDGAVAPDRTGGSANPR